MRISDWSSDVCSSDLATLRSHLPRHGPVLTNDIFILVVEDETLIEEIVVSGLEDAGYTVVAAHTAEEAIAQLEKADPVIRGIVTDENLAPEKLTGRSEEGCVGKECVRTGRVRWGPYTQ